MRRSAAVSLSLTVVLALAGCGAAGGEVQASAPAADCPQPYGTWWTATTGGRPPEPGPPRDEDLTQPQPRLDHDADGQPDAIDNPGSGPIAHLRSSDGEVVLTPPAGGFVLIEGRSLGDLDGDGRPDLSVLDVHNPEVGPQEIRRYLVPGSIRPGTYQLAEVGVRVDQASPVGDQDGDGADDLVAQDPTTGRWDVLSGRAVMATAPGDARATPPLRTVDDFLAAVRITPGAPTLVTGTTTGGEVRLVVGDVHLRSDPTTDPVPTGEGRGTTAHRSGGDRIVQYDEGDRGGTRTWAWNLDAPCTRWQPPAAPTPTEAPGNPLPRTR